MTSHLASIRSVGTALPAFQYGSEGIRRAGERWLAGREAELELFERFTTSARNRNRHFSIEVDEILSLNGLQHRAELFEREAPPLGERALNEALTRAGIAPGEITSLLFTSCSCPSIPAIDALLVERSGLPRNTRRVPIYQHGCAGGVVGLALAAQLARASGPIALASVELCSLVFHPQDASRSQLVGAAIFGDGAAGAVIDGGDDGLVILSTRSMLLPGTRHLMGYDIFDDGFHLRLDRELPSALTAAVPQLAGDFLAESGSSVAEVDYWLFHPGGVKILDSLEKALCPDPGRARWSREVLAEVGNLSSASVLFVLRRFLDSGAAQNGDRIVMLGVGPGLTVEMILFELRC